jgi:hypothetical protein
VPQRQGAFEVGESLRRGEDRLRLAGRFDRCGERLRVAARRRPVRCELCRFCRSAPRQFFREQCVQLFPLPREDRRVDRLRQERVAEAEAAGLLIGHEDPVLDRQAERLANVALRKLGHGEEWVCDIATGR